MSVLHDMIDLPLKDLSKNLQDDIVRACSNDPELALFWATKIARFANLQRNKIDVYCRQIKESNAQRSFPTFCIVILETHLRNSSQNLPAFHQTINALCWLEGVKSRTTNAGSWIAELKNQLSQMPSEPLPIGELKRLSVKTSSLRKVSVVLFAPSTRSNYTRLVMAMCLHCGIPVSAVVTKAITPSRIKEEILQIGIFRLARKVSTKFFNLPLLGRSALVLNISATGRALDIAPQLSNQSLSRLASIHGVPILRVRSFTEAEPFLNTKPEHLGIFTGGGILASSTLDACGEGTLNVHSGLLPSYRGMGVLEAPLLEGSYHKTGLSSHFLEPGIDTGPVIEKLSLRVRDLVSLQQAESAFEAFMPVLMMQAILRVIAGDTPRRQLLDEGKQYFQLHPRMQTVVENCFLKASSEALSRFHEGCVKRLNTLMSLYNGSVANITPASQDIE